MTGPSPLKLRDLSQLEHGQGPEDQAALALAEIENEPAFKDLCGAAIACGAGAISRRLALSADRDFATMRRQSQPPQPRT